MSQPGARQGRPPFRADHVGSLRRPQRLIDARKQMLAGTLPQAALTAIEDECIAEAIGMQERVGIQAVTDGEMRRNNWRDRFFERCDGFSKERVPSSFIFTDDAGKQYPGVPIPVVVGKLSRRETLTAEDFSFVHQRTKGTAKATLPAPSANHFFSGDKALAGSPYPDRKAYLQAVAAIYREEVADLARRGCTYLQIDEVPIAVLCDPANQQRVAARGEDPQSLVDDYITAINEAVRDRPAGMTVCIHLCRGNAGKGQATGGYDPVAERLLNAKVDGFFLEYDTDRAGDFTPLRFLPKDKIAVLGVMSTKVRELEPLDLVRSRLDQAAKYVDLSRLCISPQCGFASVFLEDRFTLDDQERKLAHLVKLADAIWA